MSKLSDSLQIEVKTAQQFASDYTTEMSLGILNSKSLHPMEPWQANYQRAMDANQKLIETVADLRKKGVKANFYTEAMMSDGSSGVGRKYYFAN